MLETLSEETKLSKVILAVAKKGYKVKAQRQAVSADGKTQIHIEAQSDAQIPREELETELSAIEGCRLIELEIDSADTPATDPVAIDHSAVLKEIGENYPRIQQIVKTHANSLPDDSRTAALMDIGARVGAGIYSRDYSLGSPLPMPAALHRELAPALKEFSDVKATDSSITLLECPFCAKKAGEASGCNFITGFIKGFMDKNPATPNSKVTETNCGSDNGGQCTFEIRV